MYCLSQSWQMGQTASFSYDLYFVNSHERRIGIDDTYLIATNIGDKENDTRLCAPEIVQIE